MREYASKAQSLLRELDMIKEQLTKVKKDNMCIRIAYERWKQTYDSIEALKADEEHIIKVEGTAELLTEMQTQTSELMMRVIDLQEIETTSQVELLKEEYSAKANLQEDNVKEQALMTNLKQVEERLCYLLSMVHLI